jgi:tetrathionate reductase subunit B
MIRLIDSERRPAPSRRGFLAAAAGFAATALAPGVTLYALGGEAPAARASGEPASARIRWGLLIDAGKCGEGCDRCVTACRQENGWDDSGPAETRPQWIRKVSVRDPANGTTRQPPVMCQHCAEPPCVDVCPTGASFKRADGIVLVDKHICIGCRYCMMACPYKARSFVHAPVENQKVAAPRGKGTVEGCTLCVDRIDAGQPPACVAACASEAGGAMIFGDLNNPESEIARAIASRATSQLRADLGLNPTLRYQNL